ncbi:MAG TPA: dihydrofolate reductase family protein [Candidatus Limnocylindrales bacterium]|jgi:dihydrofolate reductase
MRNLLVTTFVTLDGVMQAPGGPEEDESGGFAHGGWSFGYWDKVLDDVMTETMGRPFDLLLGHRTYDIFASYWPTAEQEAAKPLNDATKYVAAHHDVNLPWGPSVHVRDVPSEVAALKRGDGPELQVHGSANLIQTLLREGLVDEFQVLTYPLLLGSGKRLFGDGTVPAGLELVSSQVSPSGVVIARYRPAGAIKYGSF